MINSITPYIKITRPANAAMTGCAVVLGIWVSGGSVLTPKTGGAGFDPLFALLTALAAAAAVAYGNVINDLLDVKTDRVSHPDRPLAAGTMSARAAAMFAAALAACSLACAGMASMFHLTAAMVPLALLTMYSIYFKRTRIVGNFIVASLTAYALLFGSLPRPETKILFLPAAMAFLLNFCREIVKDVQDTEGDRAAGLRTSADLPAPAIKAILTGAAATYIIIVLMPSPLWLGHFGWAYAVTCLLAVIPLHLGWTFLALMPGGGLRGRAGRVSSILKLEMLAGMIALALDRGVYYFLGL